MGYKEIQYFQKTSLPAYQSCFGRQSYALALQILVTKLCFGTPDFGFADTVIKAVIIVGQAPHGIGQALPDNPARSGQVWLK